MTNEKLDLATLNPFPSLTESGTCKRILLHPLLLLHSLVCLFPSTGPTHPAWRLHSTTGSHNEKLDRCLSRQLDSDLSLCSTTSSKALCCTHGHLQRPASGELTTPGDMMLRLRRLTDEDGSSMMTTAEDDFWMMFSTRMKMMMMFAMN